MSFLPHSMDLSRRQLLRAAGAGIGGTALLSALGQSGFAGASASLQASPIAGLPAKAKNVIFLFMFGGPSQMDLFDYKPDLQKYDGRTVNHEWRRDMMKESVVLGSKRKFARYGETGQWCSDAFRYIPEHMDKLAVVKSLYTDSFAHGSAILQMNSGQAMPGHPALGAWVTHGLGTANPDLPPFVVMQDPRGGPISGPANWSSGYMPAAYQGTLFRAFGDPVLNLEAGPRASRSDLTRSMQREQIELIRRINANHPATRQGHGNPVGRDASYELAYRMQETAPEALDLSQESEATKRMYGMYDPKPDHRLSVGPAPFGRQCLIARRLLQRGVRVVQIYHGGGHQQQTWDAHLGVEANLRIHCPEVDRPIHGLLTDLERTGMLDETLVIWGGEFGRQPVQQQEGAGQTKSDVGRDHNPKGFTMWLAGAGIKPGSYGETDELGAAAARDRHHIRDLHATVLHLLGLDWSQLTYYYGGLDRKLTGVVEPKLIDGILA